MPRGGPCGHLSGESRGPFRPPSRDRPPQGRETAFPGCRATGRSAGRRGRSDRRLRPGPGRGAGGDGGHEVGHDRVGDRDGATGRAVDAHPGPTRRGSRCRRSREEQAELEGDARSADPLHPNADVDRAGEGDLLEHGTDRRPGLRSGVAPVEGSLEEGAHVVGQLGLGQLHVERWCLAAHAVAEGVGLGALPGGRGLGGQRGEPVVGEEGPPGPGVLARAARRGSRCARPCGRRTRRCGAGSPRWWRSDLLVTSGRSPCGRHPTRQWTRRRHRRATRHPGCRRPPSRRAPRRRRRSRRRAGWWPPRR